jgi:hypothetical protein
LQKIPSTKNSSNTHKTSINQLNASTKPSPLPTKENQHKASKYFKCQGFGHIALNSPTWITITIIKGEAFEIPKEEKTLKDFEDVEPLYDEELNAAEWYGFYVFCIAEFGGMYVFLCGETQILILIVNHGYMTLYIELHKNNSYL